MCALQQQLAPIVLFVYNRPEHTRKTLEALAANDLALESDLFIFSDGPKKSEDMVLVEKVRNYIMGVNGFKSVTISAREHNYGLTKSIITGVTEIVNRYGRIIVLEDDIVTSPYFLRYMQETLQFYENEERVAAINGYTFPLGITLPETFFMRHTGCWGWGTWKRSWTLFESDGRKLLEKLHTLKLTTSFDMNGAYPYTRMLKDQVNGKIDTWDILWHASNFLNDKLNLYPGVSLVRNIGHDGSGEHSYNSAFYNVNLAERDVKVSNIPVCENTCATKRLEAYFRKGHSGIIRYLIWKLFNN